MAMARVLSASLSPDAEFDDVVAALSVVFQPHIWSRGEAVDTVSRWFRERYHPSAIFTFSSGRIALYAVLHALGIKKGDEVITQAFTCVAVPNSIRWIGATPVYTDIDDSLNISPKDIEKKITPHTKAIIVQHTFGIPADMDAISRIAKAHGLILIEDCAHALGAEYNGKKLGSFGDASFFSFGRDKVLSSVWGGAAMINANCQITGAGERLKKFHTSLPYGGPGWTFQQLFHPIAFSIILPLYRSGIGKLFLVILQRLGLLSFPVFPEEKLGKMPRILMRKYPNALAVLLAKQLKKLSRYSIERRNISNRYMSALKDKEAVHVYAIPDGAVLLRYPVYVSNPEALIRKAKKRNILLGNWYHNVIDPVGVDFETIGYSKGSCPVAEDTALHIINLPTRISEKEARRVLALF